MRPTALVTAVLGGLLVAGCSTTTSGSAAPANMATSPSVTPSQDNNYGAPKVTTPLDTARWQPDPCAALTSAQQRALGITVRGAVRASDFGDICQWSVAYNVVYAVGFDVKFNPGEPLGLANAYETAGQGAMLRLPDVDGQPAATEPNQNTDGNCTIYLGATDQIEYAATVAIGAGQPHYQNPCPVAEQIADEATATMKSTKSNP